MWMFNCLYVLFGVYSTTHASTLQQDEELAVHGRAVQSSTLSDYKAAYAIDRQPSTFSHTAVISDNPWWRVDLLDSYYVAKIVITNRVDCCWSRFDGAEIHIGNSLENDGNNNPRCAVLYSVLPGQSVSVSCEDFQGRYVNVFLPGSQRILHMAEVEVYKKVYKVAMTIKFSSSLNIADPAQSDILLNQVKIVLASKGLSNFTLTWTKLPQRTKQSVRQGPCIKIYN